MLDVALVLFVIMLNLLIIKTSGRGVHSISKFKKPGCYLNGHSAVQLAVFKTHFINNKVKLHLLVGRLDYIAVSVEQGELTKPAY